MNSKPLGRDCLGRLVYASDFIDDGSKIGVVCGINRLGEVLIHYRSPLGYWIMDKVVSESTEVILDASPKRTNYERYFADLGTLGEVWEAWADLCLETFKCGECPFSWICKHYDRKYTTWSIKEILVDAAVE